MKGFYQKNNFIKTLVVCFLVILNCTQHNKPSSNLLSLFTGSIMNPTTTGIYSVGGNIQGLRGTMVIQNNQKDNLTISTNGSFSFPTRLQGEAIYSVTVLTQPTNQNCVVIDGLDIVLDSDISSISIICQRVPVRYNLGGVLSYLKEGNTVSILNNRSNELQLSANGNFTFNTGVQSGTSYSVTVFSQPSNQNCIVSNASGRMPESNLDTLIIGCYGNAKGALINGTISSPLTLTGQGVSSFVGSYCNANTTCSTGSSGYLDSTTVSSTRFQNPEGIITDGFYLYIADKSNHRIRKVNLSTGQTTTMAGNGVSSSSDGVGTNASVRNPQFLVTDGVNIYFVDSTSSAIRKIEIATSVVTTLTAGNSNLTGSRGLLIFNNNLYITDNTNNAIRRINISSNAQATILTSGIALTSPKAMTLIGSDIYMIDSSRILKTTIGVWSVSIFAGGNSGYSDGIGKGAMFNNPEGITTDGTNLYISDTGNNTIRKIVIGNASVSTVAGSTSGTSGYSNSSTYTNALFDSPVGITSDGTSLYISDKNNHTIRKIQ